MLQQLLVAPQIGFRILELNGRAILLRLRQVELGLIRRRIDNHERVADLDVLSFLEGHLRDDAVDLGRDIDRVIGLNRTDPGKVNRNFALTHRRRDHAHDTRASRSVIRRSATYRTWRKCFAYARVGIAIAGRCLTGLGPDALIPKIGRPADEQQRNR